MEGHETRLEAQEGHLSGDYLIDHVLTAEAPEQARNEPRFVYDLTLPQDGLTLPQVMDSIEELLVSQAMGRAKGNKTLAARLLGIGRTTLIMKLKKAGMHG